MKRLLDLDDRSPVLIWGNHLAGKSFALFKAFEQAGFREGIVHVKLNSDKQIAEEKLCQQLGAIVHVEAEEALRRAAKTLSRRPIIVLEIPREVSDMAVVRSCSGFAKTWGYDAELAKVIVLASSASMALSFDADAREVRFQVQPLSEEECQQEEAGLLSAFLGVFVWLSLTRSRRSSSTTVEPPPSSTSRISSTSPAATWASWRPVHCLVFPALSLQRLGVLRSLSNPAGPGAGSADQDLRGGPARNHRRAGRG